MIDQDYTFYLGVFGGDEGNDILARQLLGEDFGELLCADGQKHPLWKCTRRQLDDFLGSQKKFDITLVPYRKKGDGKIKVFNP